MELLDRRVLGIGDRQRVADGKHVWVDIGGVLEEVGLELILLFLVIVRRRHL